MCGKYICGKFMWQMYWVLGTNQVPPSLFWFLQENRGPSDVTIFVLCVSVCLPTYIYTYIQTGIPVSLSLCLNIYIGLQYCIYTYIHINVIPDIYIWGYINVYQGISRGHDRNCHPGSAIRV